MMLRESVFFLNLSQMCSCSPTHLPQIAKELQDIEEFKGDVEASSKYLATKTFESLNVLFEASQEIQDWLTECADMIAGCGENVTWVTPLGLPVVQPYTYLVAKKNGDTGITMDMNKMKHLYHLSPSEVPVKKVSKMKHKNGFPPNFIHSLDSCHMMLTSLHLWSKGITFASVHDCYWTHATDVPTMNKVSLKSSQFCIYSFTILQFRPVVTSSYLFTPHLFWRISQSTFLKDTLNTRPRSMSCQRRRGS